MSLETGIFPQARPPTDLEMSAQSSKDSISSPIDDKKDVEAQMEEQRVQILVEGLTSTADEEKPQAEQLPPRDPNLVEFDGPDDPGNPKNWSVKRRTAITISMGMMTFVVTFSSSIFAVAIEPVSREFGIGEVVSTLGVTFFLLVCLPSSLTSPMAFGNELRRASSSVLSPSAQPAKSTAGRSLSSRDTSSLPSFRSPLQSRRTSRRL